MGSLQTHTHTQTQTANRTHARMAAQSVIIVYMRLLFARVYIRMYKDHTYLLHRALLFVVAFMHACIVYNVMACIGILYSAYINIYLVVCVCVCARGPIKYGMGTTSSIWKKKFDI